MRRFFLSTLAIVLSFQTAWALTDEEARSVFQSWKLADKDIELVCLNDACKKNEALSWATKKWLAEALRKVPQFLRQALPYLGGIKWIENQNPGYLEGTAFWDQKSLTIESHRKVDLDNIMTHEIAHLYEDNSGSTVYQYLTLRFHTREFSQKIMELIDLLASYKGPDGDIKPYDIAVTRKIREIRLPHRHNLDIWAYKSNEYWAISVELYYLYKKQNQLTELTKHLSPEEIQFLQKLFEE